MFSIPPINASNLAIPTTTKKRPNLTITIPKQSAEQLELDRKEQPPAIKRMLSTKDDIQLNTAYTYTRNGKQQ